LLPLVTFLRFSVSKNVEHQNSYTFLETTYHRHCTFVINMAPRSGGELAVPLV